MEFNSVAILLTEDCNAHCKMCCDSRGLVRGKTLTVEELDVVLKNIKDCKKINDVGITGGEPLLYPDLIDRIIEYDYGRDVHISIKTNGFWGKKYNHAKELIEKYKKNLSYISLSYDEFHMEFIDIDCIKNIIMIAKDYNIQTDVVGCFLKSSVLPGDILNMLDESAYYTKFHYQPVISTGSGSLFPPEEYIKLLDLNKDTVRCVATTAPVLLINPRMDVYPCCSQVIENTILEVGNLGELSLNEILVNIKQNYVLNEIFTEGFDSFKGFLDEAEIQYPRKLASPCEFCEFLFSDDWFLKELNEKGYYENLHK